DNSPAAAVLAWFISSTTPPTICFSLPWASISMRIAMVSKYHMSRDADGGRPYAYLWTAMRVATSHRERTDDRRPRRTAYAVQEDARSSLTDLRDGLDSRGSSYPTAIMRPASAG